MYDLHGKSYSHIAAITIPFFSEHCNAQIYTNFGVIYIVHFLYTILFYGEIADKPVMTLLHSLQITEQFIDGILIPLCCITYHSYITPFL